MEAHLLGSGRTFGATIPTARELVDWAQERLKDIRSAGGASDWSMDGDCYLVVTSPYCYCLLYEHHELYDCMMYRMYTLVFIRVHPSSSVIRVIGLIKFILGLDAVELDNEQSDRPGLAGHGDSGQRHGDPQGMAQCPSAVRRLTS